MLSAVLENRCSWELHLGLTDGPHWGDHPRIDPTCESLATCPPQRQSTGAEHRAHTTAEQTVCTQSVVPGNLTVGARACVLSGVKFSSLTECVHISLSLDMCTQSVVPGNLTVGSRAFGLSGVKFSRTTECVHIPFEARTTADPNGRSQRHSTRGIAGPVHG